MPDSETIALYDARAADYEALNAQLAHDPDLLRFVERIGKGGRALDLGCGPGMAASVMRKHGLLVDAIDASAEMVRLANRRFDIGARRCSFEEFDALERYDGVWAHFSLLHATKAAFPGILHALRRASRSGATLHLGMKLGSGSGRDRLGRFYSYYSEDELREHLGSAGFVVDGVRRGEGRGFAGDVSPWAVLTASVPANEEERTFP